MPRPLGDPEMELGDWWRCSSFEELDNGGVSFSLKKSVRPAQLCPDLRKTIQVPSHGCRMSEGRGSDSTNSELLLRNNDGRLEVEQLLVANMIYIIGPPESA
jgi:hypothetical protein